MQKCQAKVKGCRGQRRCRNKAKMIFCGKVYCWRHYPYTLEYEYAGGTNTQNRRLVHYNCHKPTGAPTWEELLNSKGIN